MEINQVAPAQENEVHFIFFQFQLQYNLLKIFQFQFSLVNIFQMVAKKIKAMKDNKSLGVDGIPPKLLMETVQQSSVLARMFNLSLKEGIVPFEWKETNIIPLF